MGRKTDVIVIGGGQAGLATSHCLAKLNIDHVVFERGEIGQRWRAERWNSLRLLTPNWMSRLPGQPYSGDNPHGFMTKDAVADILTAYSMTFSAPVLEHTTVLSLRKSQTHFTAVTTGGTWRAKAVVVATGACDVPRLPRFAGSVDPSIAQVTLDRYKSTAQVAKGGVLVVGASASGCQIASELQAAGRDVTLATGRHTHLPRTYRGRDIMVWLDRIGALSATRDPSVPVDRLALQHSFQLVGSDIGRNLNLGTFQAQGGRVVGRVENAHGTLVSLGDTLGHDVATAEARQTKLLRRIDTHIDQTDLYAPAPDRTTPIHVPMSPKTLDLYRAGIRTIVWATGYRRDYSWLDLPVLTAGGDIIQTGGVTRVAGLYTMGLPFMRRCNSTFIDGVGQDAHDITRFISHHLGQRVPTAA